MIDEADVYAYVDYHHDLVTITMRLVSTAFLLRI